MDGSVFRMAIFPVLTHWPWIRPTSLPVHKQPSLNVAPLTFDPDTGQQQSPG